MTDCPIPRLIVMIAPCILCLQKRDHPAYGRHHGMSEHDWWLDFVYRVFTAAGYTGSADSLIPMSDALIKHLNANSPARETLPNVVDSLESFKRSGLVLGIVSNGDNSLIPTLKTHGLYDYFDFLQYSAATGLQKPDPKVYEQALIAAGDINPADAGHVGDEIISDYFAPRKVGMSSFLINSNARYTDDDLKGVDRECVVSSLLELSQLIDVKI